MVIKARDLQRTGFGLHVGKKSGTELNAWILLQRESLCETKKQHIYPLKQAQLWQPALFKQLHGAE